jgi:hypothetical protein
MLLPKNIIGDLSITPNQIYVINVSSDEDCGIPLR